MPYIAVKAWPKTDEQKKALAENLMKTVAETLGIPEMHVSVGIEEVESTQWEAFMQKEMENPNNKMYVIKGEKTPIMRD